MKIDGVEIQTGDRILIKEGPWHWSLWLRALLPWQTRRIWRMRKRRKRGMEQNGIWVVTAEKGQADA